MSVRDASQSVVGLVSVLSELAMQALDGPLEKAGIPFGTFQLLTAVKAGQGKLTQAELADRLGITPPSLCEAVQAAVGRGFVVQKDKPSDRRAKVIELTKTGSKKVEQVLDAIDELDDLLEKQVSPQDLNVTVHTLKSWIQAVVRESESRSK